eukprot:CAMPEP_0118912810 /NCGR_PEP_ID=MMETSP1166-20130328/13889_1 /TAXON_ID=1104430 /ORGANISM="Chrysoreinhardia sp, Strain CCMP3193" /LENGTH=485 /DNA_ID=CAMNT_0006852333 /DNA_START=30 /DNA_END=1487 /DNA_ORIENTATION=-
MRYVSTRGVEPRRFYTFEEAATTGYAPDGGLFVPESLPPISEDDLARWKGLDYASLAYEVLKPFCGGEVADLREMLTACYADFPSSSVVGLREVKEFQVLELFRGPTHCFKDLGLPFLTRVVAYFAEKRKKKRTLLLSTTGDTGPACVDAAAKLASPFLRVICTYPKDMVSEFQKRQMTRTPTTMIVQYDGGGDDMDAPIKRILQGKRHSEISGANSYNICRPLVQTVHFLWLAVHCPEKATLLALPTGAMGNLAAFVMATKRLETTTTRSSSWRLLAACNRNDFTYRALELGDCRRSPAMLKTNSDAINIQIPYNFERVLYYAGRDATSMAKIYDGSLERLPEKTTMNLRDFGLAAARVPDERTVAAIRAFSSPDYIPDPHTAVALAAAEDRLLLLPEEKNKEKDNVVVIATAHARKFEAVVKPALPDPSYWPAYVGDADHQPEGASKHHLLFARQPGESLQDAQANWEASLLAIIDQSEWPSS